MREGWWHTPHLLCTPLLCTWEVHVTLPPLLTARVFWKWPWILSPCLQQLRCFCVRCPLWIVNMHLAWSCHKKKKVNSLNSQIDVFQHARKLWNCQSNMCTANKTSIYSNTFTVKQYLIMSVWHATSTKCWKKE